MRCPALVAVCALSCSLCACSPLLTADGAESRGKLQQLLEQASPLDVSQEASSFQLAGATHDTLVKAGRDAEVHNLLSAFICQAPTNSSRDLTNAQSASELLKALTEDPPTARERLRAGLAASAAMQDGWSSWKDAPSDYDQDQCNRRLAASLAILESGAPLASEPPSWRLSQHVACDWLAANNIDSASSPSNQLDCSAYASDKQNFAAALGVEPRFLSATFMRKLVCGVGGDPDPAATARNLINDSCGNPKGQRPGLLPGGGVVVAIGIVESMGKLWEDVQKGLDALDRVQFRKQQQAMLRAIINPPEDASAALGITEASDKDAAQSPPGDAASASDANSAWALQGWMFRNLGPCAAVDTKYLVPNFSALAPPPKDHQDGEPFETAGCTKFMDEASLSGASLKAMQPNALALKLIPAYVDAAAYSLDLSHSRPQHLAELSTAAADYRKLYSSFGSKVDNGKSALEAVQSYLKLRRVAAGNLSPAEYADENQKRVGDIFTYGQPVMDSGKTIGTDVDSLKGP